MGLDPDEQEIVRLLTKLKDAGGAYPRDMLAERRRAYLSSMAGLGLAKGPEMRSNNGIKNSRRPGLPRGSGALLEMALIAVILAETSAVVYAYRHELVDFLQTNITDSRVEQAAPPEAMPTSLEIQGVSPSPAVISSTALPTATGTPIPGIADETAPDTSLLSATPGPNGNNGNHYGQTPKPERTKENNGNGNNDKPPKEDKPPKDDEPPRDEPKPTKAK